MRKYILLIAYALTIITCYSQYTPLLWAKKIEAIDQNNPSCGIAAGAIDNQGNIYAYGTFTDTVIPDQNLPTTYLTGNNNWSSGMFAKYDKDGNVIWAKKIAPRVGSFTVNSLTLDKYNNTYILCTGVSNDTVDLDPGVGVANLISTGLDFFFAKYDANGNYLWAKMLPVSNSNNAYSNSANVIRVDSNQNIYIGGRFQFRMDADPAAATVYLNNPGGINCNCTVGFYARYDSTGAYMWGIADVNNIAVVAIDVHEASQQIMVGAVPGQFTGYPLRVCSTSGITTDSLYGATIAVHSVKFDSTGNLYFSGTYANGGNDFNWGASSYILATQHTYETQGFVGKYNSSHSFQWATSYNPTGDTTFRGSHYYINKMMDGNILLSYSESNGGSVEKGFFKISATDGSALWPNAMYDLTVGLVDINALQDYTDGSIVLSVGTGASVNALYTIDAEPNPNGTFLLSAKGRWSMLAKYANCVIPPTITGSITGPASLCGTSQQTYNIPEIAGATSYLWLKPNGWSGTSTTNSITVTPSANGGMVAVVAVNECGQSLPVGLTVSYTALPVLNINATATTVCAGTAVTLTANGATTYTWNNSVVNGVAFTPASTTIYTVTGTTNSCSSTATSTINVVAIPTVGINATATTLCQGTPATLTGTGATAYTWNNGVVNGTAFTPANTNIYTVTGTTSGCSSTATVSIHVNPIPPVSISATSTTICAGTAVTLTANGATLYTWSNGVANGVAFSPASTATYTVTGTSSGCSATSTASINVNAVPQVSINAGATTLCQGSALILTASGATTYTWNNGVTNGTAFTPANTSTYIVTGTANGCSGTGTVSIQVNPSPPVSINASATTICEGSPVTLTATGATAYTWNNGVTNGIAFNPANTTTYTVTGISLGCSATATATVAVTAISPVSISASATTICEGTPVTLTANGATTYAWSNGVINGAAFPPSNTTTYTVTGTSNGCNSTAMVTVNVNQLPPVTINASSTTLCEGSQVTLIASGATTYTWNNNVTNGTAFTPANTNTYTVTGTENGCSDTATATVTVNIIPSVSVSASADTICQGTPVTLTGAGATTYAWSDNVTDNVAFSPTSTSTYNVTGSENGCSDTSSVTIIVHNVAPVTIVTLTDSICTGQTTMLIVTGSVTYEWSTGETNDSIMALPALTTVYTVTATDANNCPATADKEVALYPAADITTVVNGPTIHANQAGSNYQWINCATGTIIPGETARDYTATTNGDYRVLITSTASCADTSACVTITGVAINEIGDLAIKVWPNPFNDNLYIDFDAPQSAIEIEVFNAIGGLEKREVIFSSLLLLTLQNLNSGAYLLQVKCNGNTFRKTIVKQ